MRTKPQEVQAGEIRFMVATYGAEVEEYKSLKLVSYESEVRNEMKPFLVVFKGKAGKPVSRYYYRSVFERAKAVEESKAMADRYEARKAEMKKQPPSQAAQCASAIRVELKSNFPSVKFRVVCDNFSMGNSVDVNWTDGPTEEQVNSLIRKYQYGHFDGMQDLYEYSNSRDDIPQAKWVHGRREASDKTERFLKGWVAENFSTSHEEHEWQKEQFLNRQFREEFSKLSFPEKMFEGSDFV